MNMPMAFVRVVPFRRSSSFPSSQWPTVQLDLEVSSNSGGALFEDEKHHHGEKDVGEFAPLSSDWSVSSSSSSFTYSKSERFATGNELIHLRAKLDEMRQNLQWALSSSSSSSGTNENDIESMKKAIQREQDKDPDLVYRKSMQEIIHAKASHRLSEDEKLQRIQTWKKEAAEARKWIERFHLDGLWLGE